MDLAQLRQNLTGSLVVPGDADWDAARVFHSGIGEPELVVGARSVADVQAAVRYAAAEGLAVGVRGGGHSAWGTLPGGLVIDLTALADIEVKAPRVRIGGGATWGSIAERRRWELRGRHSLRLRRAPAGGHRVDHAVGGG